MLNDWRYQIGNQTSLPKNVSQTGASRRGAGPQGLLLL